MSNNQNKQLAKTRPNENETSVSGLSLDALIQWVRAQCAAAGSQAAFSKQSGVSANKLSEMLNGVRPPSKSVLAKLGKQKATLYVDLTPPPSKRRPKRRVV